MNLDKQISFGLIGTAISASGIGLAEISAIVSIIISVLGFTVSVFIPAILKIVAKIKEAKADGKITKKEAEDIKADLTGLVDDTKDFIEDHKENKC